MHGLLGQRALETAAIEGPDPGTSASRRVGVGATGTAALMEAARRFGAQGEGAIEGVAGDYRRVALCCIYPQKVVESEVCYDP